MGDEESLGHFLGVVGDDGIVKKFLFVLLALDDHEDCVGILGVDDAVVCWGGLVDFRRDRWILLAEDLGAQAGDAAGGRVHDLEAGFELHERHGDALLSRLCLCVLSGDWKKEQIECDASLNRDCCVCRLIICFT